MNEPIIKSLLDVDLYKFSMQQVVHHHYNGLNVRYKFKCRNSQAAATLCKLAPQIREQIDNLGTLTYTDDELTHLKTQSFLSHNYVNALKSFRLNPELVELSVQNDELNMDISGGWFESMPFETLILSITNEVYNQHMYPDDKKNKLQGTYNLMMKLALIENNKIPGFNLIEFGTRRRYSREWHEFALKRMAEVLGTTLLGTSNVDLSRRLGLKAYGTMAHEYLQAAQALYPLHKFQGCALRKWMEEYRGSLGIALTDVVGMDAFLKDFDYLFALAYAGMRHDSGDPFKWGEKAISHYGSFPTPIDSRTKNLVFSDGLNIPLAIALTEKFRDRIRVQSAIGTDLTNDMGFKALNCVIKLVEADGQPIAKISDSPGKGMCDDPVFLAHLSKVYGVPYQA